MNTPVTNSDLASTEQVVVFPPDRSLGVLAVDPPYPVGFKPQNDGALGININMVHGDRDGLLVYILAYLNMAIGDNIKVYIDLPNAPVAEFSVTQAHFDEDGNAKNIPFYIRASVMEARFLQSENKPFWFKVERVSGNGTEQSPPVQLFYKHPAPGEADTDGGKPFNQGLKLPVASESVVDQTVINDGMFVTVLAYFNQSVGDVVVLAFGSLLLESTVTALGDVIFELTPAMLATLAPTNSLVVRWEVFDRVENSSGWSDALILTFKPGMVLLTAPIFEQADPDNVVDHDGLAGADMQILVTGVFAIRDVIELTLAGLTKGGDPVTHTFSKTLTTASRTVTFSVLNEWVRNLIGGSARASYTLTRAGNTQRSKPADATFTGSSQPLGLPIVEPLVDDKLPVDTAMATVRVAEYWPLKQGAIVELRWQTTDQDGIKVLFIFQRLVTDPTQPVIFQVPAKYIAPYANTSLTVQCTVTNPGEVEVFSDLLRLMFGDAAKIVLDPPVLVAGTNPLDPLNHPRGVDVRVAFRDALPGDQARLKLLNPWPDSPTFSAQPLDQNRQATFNLDTRFLGAWHGKVPQLVWALIRGGREIAESDALVLTVNPIMDGDTRLPMPVIAGYTASELDIKKLVAGDKLSVAQWFLQVFGQYGWLRYDGFDSNGTPIFYDDLYGVPNNETLGLTRAIPLEWLKRLRNGSALRITLKINFARKPDEGTAVIFPERRYTVKVEADHPEFILDPCPMTISGANLSIEGSGLNWERSRYEPPGTFADRPASGGKQPYTYVSSNEKVASVDNMGRVTSEGNGTATITVTDAAGATGSFTVTVSNVGRLVFNATPMTREASRSWILARGGQLLHAGSPHGYSINRFKAKNFASFFYHTGIFDANSPALTVTRNDSDGRIWYQYPADHGNLRPFIYYMR